MKEHKIEINILERSFDELSPAEWELVEAARHAVSTSYAPYSNFHVGAAVRLASGHIVKGSNQENAAYPSSLCAERTALFHAGAQYPNDAPQQIAITAKDSAGFTPYPVPPCGGCRQVMLEVETRYNQSLELLLCSADTVYSIKSAKDLMPLSFDKSFLK